MNTYLTQSPIAVAANPVIRVTQKMIAEKADAHPVYVSRVLNGNVAEGEKKALIQKIASDLGYVNLRSAEAKQAKAQQSAYLSKHNFPSREAETERMNALRAQGCSNKEIANKIGVTVITVRRRIGKQDPDMSKENRNLGQKHRAQRNQERKVYTAKHTVNVYNDAVERLEEIKITLEKVRAEQDSVEKIVEMLKPDVKKAVKFLNAMSDTSDNLASLAPTTLQ